MRAIRDALASALYRPCEWTHRAVSAPSVNGFPCLGLLNLGGIFHDESDATILFILVERLGIVHRATAA